MKLYINLTFLLLTSLISIQINAQTAGSLYFDGSDNYVQISNSPLNEIGNGDFTFEAWIKGRESDSPLHPMIFSNRSNNHPPGGILFFFHSIWGGSEHKMLCLQIQNSNYFIINNGTYNGNILDNKCHHVAISRNGNTLSFYIDGELIGTTTPSYLGSISLNEPLWIGKDKPTNNTFKGIISQCRIWNIARTQDEIYESKDISLQGNEPGLIAYWEMNNENTQIVTDKTGQFHGVLGSSEQFQLQDPSWSETGCIEETISNIEDYTIDYYLKATPNPTSGLLTIQYPNINKGQLKIINAYGELLSAKAINGSTYNLDMSKYPNGIYFLQIDFGNHTITKKVAKS